MGRAWELRPGRNEPASMELMFPEVEVDGAISGELLAGNRATQRVDILRGTRDR
jgi:hypothetical protein